MTGPGLTPEECAISFRFYVTGGSPPGGRLHRAVVVDGMEFSAEADNLDAARKADTLAEVTRDEAAASISHGYGADVCRRCLATKEGSEA